MWPVGCLERPGKIPFRARGSARKAPPPAPRTDKTANTDENPRPALHSNGVGSIHMGSEVWSPTTELSSPLHPLLTGRRAGRRQAMPPRQRWLYDRKSGRSGFRLKKPAPTLPRGRPPMVVAVRNPIHPDNPTPIRLGTSPPLGLPLVAVLPNAYPLLRRCPTGRPGRLIASPKLLFRPKPVLFRRAALTTSGLPI